MKEDGDRSIRRPAYPARPHGQFRPPWRLGTGRETHLGQRRCAAPTGRKHDRSRTYHQIPSKTSCIKGAVQTRGFRRRSNAGNGSLNKPETTPPTYFHHLRDGTGTTATPPKRPDSSCDYFDVSGGPSRNRTGEFTGLGWRFPPASGGDYNRPRVAITPGPCRQTPQHRR